MKKISILIVDDSDTATKILTTIFAAEKDFEVIACAKNGQQAVELNALFKPDLITMDIQMPIMDGIKATREIMSTHPVPIIVISSKLDAEMKMSFAALEAGALSVLEKPKNIASPDFDKERKYIIDTIRSMAEIKVIRRRMFAKKIIEKILPFNLTQQQNSSKPGHYEIIAIGTSLGGPQALKILLSKLPNNFPLPIVVVQHMTVGFMGGFVKWLNDNVTMQVKEATHRELLEGGTVYFAPDSTHLEIDKVRGKLIAKLVDASPVSGFCPSATVLLKSVAKTCGANAIGILLTGMGDDGAQGLLQLKNVHAHTIVQDPDTSIVFGMAGVAQSLGAVDKVIRIDKLAEYLVSTLENSREDAPL